MTVDKIYKVLCVEDMLANRDLLKMILDHRGDLECSFAEDGLSGLEAANKIKPDLILLDISLPDINGVEVLNSLKINMDTAHIPTIAISGDSLPQMSSTPTVFFDRFLPKPIQIQPLYAAIDELLAI